MNLFIFIHVFLIPFTSAFEPICRKLHVSTDIVQTKDDIVKAGISSEPWSKNVVTPVLVNSSILFEFLYITLDSKQILTTDMLKLEFDDHYFANSTIELENHKENIYSVRVDYKCKLYGGALIDYELSINIPDCGIARMFWTKICGTPMVKRHGLAMDVSYLKFNSTIVKDGGLVNTSYFDKDIDNYAFTVPANVNQSIFYLYMDLPQGQQSDSKEESKEFFQAVDKEIEEQDASSDEFQVLESILKMVPEVKISLPYVDADHTYLKPELKGDLSSGGIVTDEAQTIILEYNCITSGETTIELNIPLDYFQDITMVFVKECEVSSIGSQSFIFKLFLILLVIVVIYFIYTLNSKRINLDWILGLFRKIDKNQRNYYKAREEDYESEFKIGRLDQESGKYGSI